MPTQTIDSGTYRATTARGPVIPSIPIKFSWGAVFAGVVSALGIWILLYALGLALGLSTVNPDSPGSVKGSGIFTGIWSLIVPLIALFVGGFVAARGSGALSRGGGALHGLVVWGLVTVAGLWMVGNFFGAVFSGAGKVVEAGTKAVGMAAPAVGEQAEKLNLDADRLLQPVNERLRAEGKPEITADQLQATTRDIAQSVATTGKVDRQMLVDSLTRNTGMEQQDVDDLANRIEAQVNQTAQQAQTTALKAADATGKVFWGVFGALLLGLIAAQLGGFVGAPRKAERVVAVQ